MTAYYSSAISFSAGELMRTAQALRIPQPAAHQLPRWCAWPVLRHGLCTIHGFPADQLCGIFNKHAREPGDSPVRRKTACWSKGIGLPPHAVDDLRLRQPV